MFRRFPELSQRDEEGRAFESRIFRIMVGRAVRACRHWIPLSGALGRDYVPAQIVSPPLMER